MEKYKHFSLETDPRLACRCCGRDYMDHNFMLKLDYLRDLLGFPLVVSSGYRCSAYNQIVSSTGEAGPHTTGEAVDIAIHGERAYILVGAAAMLDFTGIGVAQSGERRFIHLDTLTRQPRPRIWSY